MNNEFVANIDGVTTNPHLRYGYEKGYEVQRRMDLSAVTVKAVSAPMAYSSEVASSDHAVAIYMNVGTMYTYVESRLFHPTPGSDTVIGTVPSFVDFNRNALVTPRQFDDVDVNENNDQVLIYDLIEKKVIDYYGNQNYFYATKYFKAPTITML